MAYTTIDDPSAHFQTALYAGNNTTDHNITNDGNSNLQPDFVWIKQRTSNNPHVLQDTSRGFAGNGEANVLQSNDTAAEVTNGAFESFNTNGFGVGGTNVASGAYNLSGSNYVAWQWKCAGGTTTNQTGANIDSVTQANTTAGFSIVTYTGNGGAGQSVKHGLGATPQMFIIKRRDGTGDWFVYHQAMGNTKHLHLNTTAAVSTTSDFGNYGPDSTSFFVNNTGTCINNETYVAYCFADVQGYSKFGSYVGNGSGTSDGTFDGPFVYTGFKPSWLMIKRFDGGAEDWNIFDNKRPRSNSTGNYINNKLYSNQASAESGSVYDAVDFLSNGFKIKTGRGGTNTSSGTYLYMAFAENPFTTSTGIMGTAR